MAELEPEDNRIGNLGSEDPLPWEEWRQWPDEIERETARVLPNLGGTIVYQNTIYQMLFHYPVFLQWLNYYYREHSGREERRCREGTNGMECKLCQFLHLARNYWEEDEEECFSRHQAFVNIILADWNNGRHAGREQNILDFYVELQSQFRHQIPSDDQRSVYRRAHRFREEFSKVFAFETFLTRECRGLNPCPIVRGEETPYNWAVQVGNDPALSLMTHPASEIFSPEEDGRCNNCGRNPIIARNVVEESPEIIVLRAPRKVFSRRDIGAVLTHIELSSFLELKRAVFDGRFADVGDVRYELFTVFVQVAPRRNEAEITNENEPEDDYRSLVKSNGQWADISEESEEGPTLIDEIEDWEWNTGQASMEYKRRGYVLAFRRLASGTIPPKRAIEYQTSRLDDLAVGFSASTVPNPGVLTLTFEVGEGSGEAEGPEGSTTNTNTVVDRARMRAVPFADLTLTLPMDSLNFPGNNPTGRLLIEFQDCQNQIVDTFEIRGILRDLINKRPTEPEGEKPSGIRKRRRRSRVRDALKDALRRSGKKQESQEGELDILS
ncbi:hypothetical protein N7540_007841 [Penicillium herquei]|nr:hypothetical protein N7540_007841 [Penicillium herquei]